MNCKPGDLAYITHPDHYGRMVHVLSLAPAGVMFRLPNGKIHDKCHADDWICESAGGHFMVQVSGKVVPEPNRIACIHDRWLRPIRDPGDDAVDETLRPIVEDAAA